jgi:hypothetical protein
MTNLTTSGLNENGLAPLDAAGQQVQKDKFATLLSTYSTLNARFFDHCYKMNAMQLVVVGWLISSESASQAIRRQPMTAFVGAVVVILGVVIFIVGLRRIVNNSQSARSELDALSYIDKKYYLHHEIPTTANIGLSALVILIGVTTLVVLVGIVR